MVAVSNGSDFERLDHGKHLPSRNLLVELFCGDHRIWIPVIIGDPYERHRVQSHNDIESVVFSCSDHKATEEADQAPQQDLL